MTVTYKPSPDHIPHKRLTREIIAEIEAHAPRDEDIAYDEDCPPMTDEQLQQFRRVNPLPVFAEQTEKYG